MTSTANRLIGVLFGSTALSSTAFIAIVTVASIVGATLTGSPTLAGLPSTAATVGSAAGAVVIGWAGSRIGRRNSFAASWLLAAVAAGMAGLAIEAGSFWWFTLALFAIGFGRSSSQLSRYAAGDLRSESRRGSAIAIIVWAGTIGAVVGPLLIGPAGDWARVAGRSELSGPVLVGAAIFGVAALVTFALLRPDPLEIAVDEDPTVDRAGLAHPTDLDLRGLLTRPTVALSIATLAIGQAVMVLVMTMTPVHIRAVGDDLRTVGWVMMAHTLGMFAIAPLTGWFVARSGPRAVLMAGAGVLAVSCLAAALATKAEFGRLVMSLFGLGVGWNFGFVAASTLVQEGLTIPERVRIQGIADATTWSAGAAASALSGVVLATTSYSMLGIVGAALTLMIWVAIVRWGRVATA